MILFRIFWVIDTIAALVLLYFFFVGLADGSVSSFNIALWLVILAVLAVIVFGSIWLRGHNYPGFALALLLVLAIPGLCYGAYMLLYIFGNGRMN